MWVKVIANRRVFDERMDRQRFRDAFMSLAERTTWPAPADFLSALPDRPKPKLVPRIESEEQRERNKARVREIVSQMEGFKSTRGGEDAA